MSVLAIIFFIAIGVFTAWLVDINFLSVNRNSEKIEGYALIQMLKENPNYDSVRGYKEVHSVRANPDHDNCDRGLDNPRDRRDGGQILQLHTRE